VRTEKQEKMRRLSAKLFDIMIDYQLGYKAQGIIEEVRDFLHEEEDKEGGARK
jgi:hypothetical protein|tara:strand:+ start:11 stop:169 length:159 start_codon:yes stop_codon:yes gene_type:complete